MGKISIGNTSVSHWPLVWQILSRMRLSKGKQLTVYLSLIFLGIKILYVHEHTFPHSVNNCLSYLMSGRYQTAVTIQIFICLPTSLQDESPADDRPQFELPLMTTLCNSWAKFCVSSPPWHSTLRHLQSAVS